jgi:hypothetical protein
MVSRLLVSTKASLTIIWTCLLGPKSRLSTAAGSGASGGECEQRFDFHLALSLTPRQFQPVSGELNTVASYCRRNVTLLDSRLAISGFR